MYSNKKDKCCAVFSRILLAQFYVKKLHSKVMAQLLIAMSTGAIPETFCLILR